jgi:hypothetical protein
MAYIERRSNGFLVQWRDAETRKKLSRQYKWAGDPNSVGGVVTKEGSLLQAEASVAEF